MTRHRSVNGTLTGEQGARLTRHGGRRLRERSGLPKRSIQRLANEALERGCTHRDFSGNFKRYIDGVYLAEKRANNIRIFNEHLFLFAGSALVTAWRLPHDFVAAANKAARRKASALNPSTEEQSAIQSRE